MKMDLVLLGACALLLVSQAALAAPTPVVPPAEPAQQRSSSTLPSVEARAPDEPGGQPSLPSPRTPPAAAPTEPDPSALGSPRSPPPARRRPAADEPPPMRMLGPEPPSEPGLAVGQFFAGMGVLVLGGAAFEGNPGALLVLPLLSGAIVCAVGSASRYNDGSCLASIGGAYVGALATIPLLLLGASAGAGTDFNEFRGAIVGALIGWYVVQPLLSTLSWHLFKAPKRRASMAALPGIPAAPRLRLDSPRASAHATAAPGQLSFSLLHASF